ncbi:MAG: hypothetical protein WD800_04915 [Dehalococcoidia bacterium]
MNHPIRNFVAIPVAILAMGLFSACAEEGANGDDPFLGGGDTGVSTPATGGGMTEGSDTIDRDTILNELSEVQAMLAAGSSSFGGDVVTDVNYQDGQLTVTTSGDIQGLEDAEALCQDMSTAISDSGLSIVIVDPQGAELAQCG